MQHPGLHNHKSSHLTLEITSNLSQQLDVTLEGVGGLAFKVQQMNLDLSTEDLGCGLKKANTTHRDRQEIVAIRELRQATAHHELQQCQPTENRVPKDIHLDTLRTQLGSFRTFCCMYSVPIQFHFNSSTRRGLIPEKLRPLQDGLIKVMLLEGQL